MTRTVIAALALTTVLMSACDAMVGCDDYAAASVMVTVEDEDGTLIDDADVTFVAVGSTDTECSSSGSGEYSCGYEVDGEIVVTATADGFGTDTGTVTILKDECHVIGQTMTLVLPIED